MQKKTLLQKQAVEVTTRIRELGALPQEAFRYEKMKSDAVVKRLHKVNEALKKYGHVNKKAFQQYNGRLIDQSSLCSSYRNDFRVSRRRAILAALTHAQRQSWTRVGSAAQGTVDAVGA